MESNLRISYGIERNKGVHQENVAKYLARKIQTTKGLEHNDVEVKKFESSFAERGIESWK